MDHAQLLGDHSSQVGRRLEVGDVGDACERHVAKQAGRARYVASG
jgi:hypothetical protein